MPTCRKCGTPVPVNDEGMAPVYCDRCARQAIARAGRGMRTGTMRDFPVTTALAAINLAVFAGMVLTTSSFVEFNGHDLVLWGGNFGPLTLGGEYWRLVTAAFVHGGIIHIAFNMWCLWSLGQLSERLFGSWPTAAVYVLTGVGGSLLSTAYDPGRLSVGASGAIFGIAGAILAGLKFGNLAIGSGERRSIMSSMVFFVGINFFLGSTGRTDNMCHLGGFVSGLILGLPLAVSLNTSGARAKFFQAATLLLTALLLTAAGAELVQSKGHAQRIGSAAMVAMQQAETSLERQDFASAIKILERVTAADPDNAQAEVMLGFAYESVHQRKDAIQAYQKAAALDPGRKDVQNEIRKLQENAPAADPK